MALNITAKPEMITWPLSHYIFVEKIGPFQETARAAWEMVHQHLGELEAENHITERMSLYKIIPEMIYRAGIVVDKKPVHIPEGFQYEAFSGGKYARFIYTGSYMFMGEACGEVFDKLHDLKIHSPENAFYIEQYMNDPKTTPEEQLKTGILIPTV